MAGRADGSAIKALFSPIKGDPPPQVKKKNKSPPPKNAPPPDQNGKTPPKKLPSPDKKSPEKEEKKNTQEKEKENSWTAPPKIQVDVDDLLQRAKAISSEVQGHGLMFNLEEVRQDQKKRTVSVFVVGKRSRKIVKPAKDMVLRQISSLGVKAQAIIAGASCAFWDILLPTIEDAVTLTKKSLENKEYFFRTEYMGQRRTTVSIYEVPSFLRDANLAAYMLQFGDIVSATHDGMRGEWRFDIMLDMKTFYSVPNWLEVEGRRLPVIVSGRKPACWHCGEIGHLSAVCPGKKAPKKPDHKPDTLSPVVKTNTEKCSTMWVGCQSRWFLCLFWRETRQRILGHEISPYPEVGRGREWELTTRPSRGQLAAGEQRGQLAAGQQRGEQERLAWNTDRGSQHQTPEQRGEAAWDRVQREWVKMSLIPVALWNFR